MIVITNGKSIKDEKKTSTMKKRRMKENLAHWAAVGDIPRQQVNELLKVLRSANQQIIYLEINLYCCIRPFLKKSLK